MVTLLGKRELFAFFLSFFMVLGRGEGGVVSMACVLQPWFALPFGFNGRLRSMIVFIPGHPLYIFSTLVQLFSNLLCYPDHGFIPHS